METETVLKLTKQQALKLYPNASPDFKEMLETSFGKEFFKCKMRDLIDSFEAACAFNGTDSDQQHKFIYGDPDSIAFEKLKEIAKALRGGKQLSYKNASQEKWYPIHEYTASGFRFGHSDYDLTFTHAPVGLCLETKEDSDYFGKQFINLFEQYKN